MRDIKHALIVGSITGIATLAFVAIRMAIGLGDGVDMIVLPLVFIGSSVICMMAVDKSLKEKYRGTLSMLTYASIFSSFIFAAGYDFLDDHFYPNETTTDAPFMGVVVVQLMVRHPIDIITAIFR